jgi:hypothetical protein
MNIEKILITKQLVISFNIPKRWVVFQTQNQLQINCAEFTARTLSKMFDVMINASCLQYSANH